MQTRYRNTLTCIVPQTDWAHMNELAVQFGEGEPDAERRTFVSVRYTRNGTGYAYISTNVTDTVADAVRAGTGLPGGSLALTEFNPDLPPTYSGGTIAGVNVDAQGILAAYGFQSADD